MDATDPANKSSFVRLTATIIGLTVGIAFIMSMMERRTIMANWKDRRCDLSSIFAGAFFKPSDYAGSASDFAAENFAFCLKSGARAMAEMALAPAVNTMGQQINSGGVIVSVVNSLRNRLATMVRDFFSFFMEKIYGPYRRGIYEVSRVTQYLNSMIKRVNAVIVAALYAGLTMYLTLQNTIKFVFWVSITILTILSAVFVIMFFGLLPFLGIITSVITLITLASSALGPLVEGPADVFCFAPGTPISTSNGDMCPVEDLTYGTVLLGGGVVEGVVRFNGSGTTMYNIDNVYVSGTHLVYDGERICPVHEHSRAAPSSHTCPVVYCPIVSNRVLFAGRALTKFCDWEEVSGEAEDIYDEEVRRLLGIPRSGTSLPPGIAGDTPVITKNNGPTSIRDVNIGDIIIDVNNTYTEVVGISRRTISVSACSSSAEVTDGVIAADEKGSWDYVGEGVGLKSGDQATLEVYHLITSSGTFMLQLGGKWCCVRDFTEVGWQRIDELTPLVLRHLNGRATA
jgi:hypothetical protein